MMIDREMVRIGTVPVRARAPTRAFRHPVRSIGSLLLIIVLVQTCTSPAQARIRLGASPMKFQISLRPGTDQTRVVTVYNSGDEIVRVVTSVSDWMSTPDGGMDLSPSTTGGRSATAWVKPDLSEFIVGPHESRLVRILASLPDTAQGSYWTIVFFEGESASLKSGLGLRTKARIGSTIYLTARGTERRDDELTGVDVTAGRDLSEIGLSFNLANRGNVHYYPTGWLQVLGPGDEQIMEEKIPLRVLLPETETTYRHSWHPPYPGAFRFVVTLDVGVETLIQGIREFTVQDTLPLVKLVFPDINETGAPPAGDGSAK
jgi:hypothetical protein